MSGRLAGTQATRAAIAVALAVALALVTAGCGGGSDSGQSSADGRSELAAEVASFDLAIDRSERFTVGFFAPDDRVLAYGAVTFRFAYAGTAAAPRTNTTAGPPVEASFLPVAGQDVDPDRPGPRLVTPSQARGVYGATGVRFDEAGVWTVIAEGEVDGREFRTQAAFPVEDEPQVLSVGDAAPATRNPLPGDPNVPPPAVDSRADDGDVPDPALHSTTIADALAAGRPLVVVVSTPVFCVSRFCGPITDEVDRLAQEFGDRAAFVHLEVWQDFENQEVNPAAGEWIFPGDGSEAHEPWVFMVGADGVVQARFDNAVSDAELRGAVEAVAGA